MRIKYDGLMILGERKTKKAKIGHARTLFAWLLLDIMTPYNAAPELHAKSKRKKLDVVREMKLVSSPCPV